LICDEKKEKGILAAVLWLLALVIFLPLYFVVINSLRASLKNMLKVTKMIDNRFNLC